MWNGVFLQHYIQVLIKAFINLKVSCYWPPMMYICVMSCKLAISSNALGKVVVVRHIIATRLIPASIRQRAADSRSMPQICMWNGALCLPCVVKEGTNWNLNELWNGGSANTVYIDTSIFLQHKGQFGVFFGKAQINWLVYAGKKCKTSRKFPIYESHDTAHCVYVCTSYWTRLEENHWLLLINSFFGS